MNPRDPQATADSETVVPVDAIGMSFRTKGEALIIVLLFLVLISGLMLAYYSGLTSEGTSTAAWKNAVTTRELADSAIYLDIAQIRDATAGFMHNADGSLDLNAPAGWASQPGAIRVFSTNFPGSGTILYKLYSAPSLIDASGNGNPSNDLPPAGWANRTALYVDLNSPVWSASAGTNVYPIMDPSLAMTNPASGLANSSYVDGFAINSKAATLIGASNPAAMPVSWLYVLRDGTLIAPDAGGGTTATFSSASAQPASNNPIVGRIAFWTDDETCKLNINTASEGVPWNTPAFQSLEDLHAQNSPPAGNEFNRFLGHPASVSLSPVLWSLYGFPDPSSLIWATPGSSGTGTNFEWGYYTPVMPTTLSGGLFTSPTNYVNALFGQQNLVQGILPRIGWATNGSVFGGVNLLVSQQDDVSPAAIAEIGPALCLPGRDFLHDRRALPCPQQRAPHPADSGPSRIFPDHPEPGTGSQHLQPPPDLHLAAQRDQRIQSQHRQPHPRLPVGNGALVPSRQANGQMLHARDKCLLLHPV